MASEPDIVQRLRAPDYWMSGSKEGHEGMNGAPLEAVAEIERLRADLDAAHARGVAKGRAEMKEEAARVGYRTCAETRHVTLGQKVEDAIRALETDT